MSWCAAGTSEVIIAIVDTGADLSHPDLAASLWVNPGEIPGNGIDDDGNGEQRAAAIIMMHCLTQ